MTATFIVCMMTTSCDNGYLRTRDEGNRRTRRQPSHMTCTMAADVNNGGRHRHPLFLACFVIYAPPETVQFS